LRACKYMSHHYSVINAEDYPFELLNEEVNDYYDSYSALSEFSNSD